MSIYIPLRPESRFAFEQIQKEANLAYVNKYDATHIWKRDGRFEYHLDMVLSYLPFAGF